MLIDFLINIFDENRHKDAIVWRDQVYTYAWLLDRLRYWQRRLDAEGIHEGAIVILDGDFSPDSVALYLALIELRAVVVPLSKAVRSQKSKFVSIAEGEVSIVLDKDDNVEVTRLENLVTHEHYANLRSLRHPGVVFFSSGSTGERKASVHDVTSLLEKFKVKRYSRRILTFLLFDHMGGLNTMLYALSNAGCIVTVADRSPDGVLEAVQKHKVDLLPITPTFINLILISEAYKRHKLDTLRTVSYGTEPMPEQTLRKFHGLFPTIELLQTYGLTEVGVLRSKSRSSDSLWVRIGGEDFETRVVDNVLHIKAKSAMLGYLNSPSPYTSDGWLNTGDSVEVDGEYFRILGRESEIINVGGEKVYPTEVESVIQEMDNVAEVTVYSEKNAILGNIVCADVRLTSPEDLKEFSARLKKSCGESLQRYKVPVKVNIVQKDHHSERFKKLRVRNR